MLIKKRLNPFRKIYKKMEKLSSQIFRLKKSN